MSTLDEITKNLDQLIHNEENLQSLRDDLQFAIELNALTKTQESLRAHLLFLGDIHKQTKKRFVTISDLEKKQKIYVKALHYNRFSNSALPSFASFAGLFKHNQMHIRKNRLKKRFTVNV